MADKIAVKKTACPPAIYFHTTDSGIFSTGMYTDIVIFDAVMIRDRSKLLTNRSQKQMV